jgi:hypothetical protein
LAPPRLRLFIYADGSDVPETTSSMAAAEAFRERDGLEALLVDRVRVRFKDAFGGDCPPYTT